MPTMRLPSRPSSSSTWPRPRWREFSSFRRAALVEPGFVLGRLEALFNQPSSISHL